MLNLKISTRWGFEVASAQIRWIVGDDPVALSPPVHRDASRPRGIRRAREPFPGKAAPPQQDRHLVDAEIDRDALVGDPNSRREDDPRPRRQPLLGRPGPHERAQRLTLGLVDHQRSGGVVRHAGKRICHRQKHRAFSGLSH